MKNKKKLLLEIAGIIFFASLLGFAYHFTLPQKKQLFHFKVANDSSNNILKIKPIANIDSLKKAIINELDLSGEYGSITLEQVWALSKDSSVIIIDARKPDAYNISHIDNAINIYPYAFQSESELVAKITSLPSDKLFVVYCDGGDCDLSHEIANKMKMLGFKHVTLFHGGWAEWVKKFNV
jgi:rhodanese-related sulfurtransferase